MMGRRQVLKSGDEYDAVTRWRRLMYGRAGERKAIKRHLNQRFRKEGRLAVRVEQGAR